MRRFDGQATIGIDFLSKTMYLEDRTVRLQLWYARPNWQPDRLLARVLMALCVSTEPPAARSAYARRVLSLELAHTQGHCGPGAV